MTISVMTLGEYGIPKVVGSGGYDVSNQTELEIEFTKPSGTVVSKTTADGVAVGGSNITTDRGPLLTDQYATWTITQGFIDETGVWSARLKYTDATPRKLIGPKDTFQVNA